MTATRRRRAGVIVTLVAAGVATVGGGFASGVGAALKNPCKVLRKVEIQAAFGGVVGSARKGPGTAASMQCEYEVSPDGTRPEGTVTVKVVTNKAEAAFAALARSKRYAAIDDIPEALWSADDHAVQILQGDVLVGVQGGFLVTDPLPLQFHDDRDQLTGLARIAVDRYATS